MGLDFTDRVDVDGGNGKEREGVIQGTGIEGAVEAVDRNARRGLRNDRIGLGRAGAVGEED